MIKRISYSYVSEQIEKTKTSIRNEGLYSQKGLTSVVNFYNDGKEKLAFKEYKPEFRAGMCNHIEKLFGEVSKSPEYNSALSVRGAFPRYLVFDENTFRGFVMLRLWNQCYKTNEYDSMKSERNLSAFWMEIESNRYDLELLKTFASSLINSIFTFHNYGYILGDAISDRNVFVGKENYMLFPFFIDVDSFRKEGTDHPNKAYNSDNYIPPEGKDKISTKQSDIYKMCLIILRVFATRKSQPGKLRSIVYDSSDSTVKNSLNKIERAYGAEFRILVEKGLSTNPYNRPQISEFHIAIFRNKGSSSKSASVSSKPSSIVAQKTSTNSSASTTQRTSIAASTSTSRPASKPASKATTVAMKPKPQPRKKTVWERFMKPKIARWGVIFLILFLVYNFYLIDPLCIFGVADVDPDYVWLRDGQSVETNILLYPDSYKNEKYTFKLSEHDKNIISVSDDGVVTANKFDSGDAFDFAQIHIIPANEPKTPSWLQKENKGITCIVDNHDKVKPYKEGKTKENNEIVISDNWDELFEKCEFIDCTFLIETDKDVNIRKIEFFTRESKDDEWDKLGTKESSDEGLQYITNSIFTFDGDNAISTKKLKLFSRNVKEIKVIYTLENETNYKLWIRAARR